MATASEKGNVIRIFNAFSGYIIQQVRRGNEYATLYGIAFEPLGRLMAVASDSRKVHVFVVTQFEDEIKQLALQGETLVEPKNDIGCLGSIFDFEYFKMETSQAFFYVDDIKKLVTFGVELNQIIVITDSGLFYEVEYDLNRKGLVEARKPPINFLNL